MVNMDGQKDIHRVRLEAAAVANAEDAAVWRWFSDLFEERRIRWCHSGTGWLITVDHRHIATAESFDNAICDAKVGVDMKPSKETV